MSLRGRSWCASHARRLGRQTENDVSILATRDAERQIVFPHLSMEIDIYKLVSGPDTCRLRSRTSAAADSARTSCARLHHNSANAGSTAGTKRGPSGRYARRVVGLAELSRAFCIQVRTSVDRSLDAGSNASRLSRPMISSSSAIASAALRAASSNVVAKSNDAGWRLV
jgi:hypothetical protein